LNWAEAGAGFQAGSEEESGPETVEIAKAL